MGGLSMSQIWYAAFSEDFVGQAQKIFKKLDKFTQVSDETFHETGIYVLKQALRHIVSKMIGVSPAWY